MIGRRPLVQQGGSRHAGGGPEHELLLHALEVAAQEPADRLTHGFHSWTARLHPSLAGELVPALTSARGTVLDPFSGSGTVPLEAMLHGRRGVGADLNPLAPRLGRVKCRITTDVERADFVSTARDVADRSLDRVQRRAPIAVPVPRAVALAFDGHVLKELGGLREEIDAVEHLADREALSIVLSSVVTKVSRREADSSDREVDKRIRKGLATELFERKARELSERWRQLAEELPRGATAPTLLESDVRTLPRAIGKGARFEMVLTSPPYGGTYDYVEHHRQRLALLGLDARRLESDEIGARRRSEGPTSFDRFDADTRDYLAVVAELLVDDGSLVLVVGDGLVDGQFVSAKEHLAHVGRPLGLEPVAYASEVRGVNRDDAVREEHVLLFRRRPGGRPSRPGRGPAGGPRSDGGQGSRARGGVRPLRSDGPTSPRRTDRGPGNRRA